MTALVVNMTPDSGVRDRVVGIGLAEEILATFLGTPFEGGRHARRVDAPGTPTPGLSVG